MYLVFLGQLCLVFLGQKVYEGDPKITLFPPHMVAIDPMNPVSDWHIIMVKGNKYELAYRDWEPANATKVCF